MPQFIFPASLHINQQNQQNPQQYKNPFSVSFSNQQWNGSQQTRAEIQCQDISQSQVSPAVAIRQVPQNPPPQLPPQQPLMAAEMTPPALNSNPNTNQNNSNANNNNNSNMGSETYQRTLEYVQNCQNWAESAADMVSSSTHPSSNLVINDMSTSLNSFFEEDRYLQMIQ